MVMRIPTEVCLIVIIMGVSCNSFNDLLGHGYSHGGELAHAKQEKHDGRNHMFGYGKSHDHGSNAHSHDHSNSHGHAHGVGEEGHSHDHGHGHSHGHSHGPGKESQKEYLLSMSISLSILKSSVNLRQSLCSCCVFYLEGIDAMDESSHVAQEAAREGGRHQIMQGIKSIFMLFNCFILKFLYLFRSLLACTS